MSILDIERQIGEQRGRQEGEQIGEQRGVQKGRQEGRQEGKLIGYIHAAQLRGGVPLTPEKTLAEKTLDQLRAILEKLWPEAVARAL